MTTSSDMLKAETSLVCFACGTVFGQDNCFYLANKVCPGCAGQGAIQSLSSALALEKVEARVLTNGI